MSSETVGTWTSQFGDCKE